MYLSETDKRTIKSFLTESFINIVYSTPEDLPYIASKKDFVSIEFNGQSFGIVSIPKQTPLDDFREDALKTIAANAFLEQASDKEIQNVLKEAAIYDEYIEEQIELARADAEAQATYSM